MRPASDRFPFWMPTPTYPRSERQLPGTGTPPRLGRFGDSLADMTDSGLRGGLPSRVKGYDPVRSPAAILMDTVAHLQLEVEALKCEQLGQLTLTRQISPVRSKLAVLTSTKVPKFSGVTSWDQYRQVFDAIVWSNGWDDATVALQLLSHLDGDALNVALLVPEVKRTTRDGLIRALTEHYGPPGRLAYYRPQFERTGRKEREDP